MLGGIKTTEADVLARAQQLAATLKVGAGKLAYQPARETHAPAGLQHFYCMQQCLEVQQQRVQCVVAASCLPSTLLARCHAEVPLTFPLQPYRISFDRVSSGSIFHQCVYVLCSTEADTMQARAGWMAQRSREVLVVEARCWRGWYCR